MARGRRGGGPADLRGTLGTLLRSTLQQVGMVKDGVLRQAAEQRVWIDGALLQRKHREALAALGSLVYERILGGELGELEEIPEIARVVRRIEELEVRLEQASERARATAARAQRVASDFAARAGFPTGGRMTRRGPGELGDDDAGEMRVWRPVLPDDDEDLFDDEPDATAAPAPQPKRPRPTSRRPRRAARGAGGIQFVDDGPSDDDDLEEYMHPDDVPDVTADGENS